MGKKVKLVAETNSVFGKGDILDVKKYDKESDEYLVGDSSCAIWMKRNKFELYEPEENKRGIYR